MALAHSSKDTFVKLWDLDTQHCFHTIVGHRSEVCDGVCVCVRACVRVCVCACVCGDVVVWKCVGWNVGVVGVGSRECGLFAIRRDSVTEGHKVLSLL